MNKEHSSYYYILGLQPGASPDEIKSAFRRLVKLYHADHDQSLDAEMKYREIREAYGALIRQTVTNKSDSASDFSKQKERPQASSSWQAKNNQWSASSTRTAWNASDWAIEQDHDDERLPFKLENLSAIFSKSLKEMSDASPIECFTGLIALIFVFMSCFNGERSILWFFEYSYLLVLFYVVSCVFYVFFQYHFQPSKWPFFMIFLTGTLYGVILALTITIFYSVPKGHLFTSGFWAAAAAWFLMVDPER